MTLTIRAAHRGVVDFSKADVLDLSWWRKTNLLIRAMVKDDEMTMIRAAFDYQRSLAGNSNLTDESFTKTQKTAIELFSDLQNAMSPWLAKTADERMNQQVLGLVDAYKKFVGDPNEPAFQQKLLHDMQLVERQQAESAAAKPETEEQRINRLLKERDEHYRRQVP